MEEYRVQKLIDSKIGSVNCGVAFLAIMMMGFVCIITKVIETVHPGALELATQSLWLELLESLK